MKVIKISYQLIKSFARFNHVYKEACFIDLTILSQTGWFKVLTTFVYTFQSANQFREI